MNGLEESAPLITTNRQQRDRGLGTYLLYTLVTQAVKGRIDLVEDVQIGVQFAMQILMTKSCKRNPANEIVNG